MKTSVPAQLPYSENHTPTDGTGIPGGSPTIGVGVRHLLGEQLRALYSAFTCEALPQPLLELLVRLERFTQERTGDAGGRFRSELLEALPDLRGFALSLAQHADADDLVQETLVKAWQNQHRYTPGTNLKAWLFTILRNHFYSQIRKHRREVEDADGVAASKLIALPNQEHTVTLDRVAFQLHRLPATQREALMLVGAQGMTYEAAAGVLGYQIGTVKSRVSRSRAALVEALGLEEERSPA